MSSTEIALAVAAAVLLFWGVGAYNRLMSLRNEIARHFATVEAQLQQRRQLLGNWIELLRSALPEGARTLDAVAAAGGQLDVACNAVRSHPASARAVASLRLAEETLVDARARLAAELANTPEPGGSEDVTRLADELATVDIALGFARRQFNEAALGYNRAVRQFPTWVAAALFGFRVAGTL